LTENRMVIFSVAATRGFFRLSDCGQIGSAAL